YVFLSSRRRHTRFSRDWSSDVCSSDLLVGVYEQQRRLLRHRDEGERVRHRAASLTRSVPGHHNLLDFFPLAPSVRDHNDGHADFKDHSFRRDVFRQAALAAIAYDHQVAMQRIENRLLGLTSAPEYAELN